MNIGIWHSPNPKYLFRDHKFLTCFYEKLKTDSYGFFDQSDGFTISFSNFPTLLLHIRNVGCELFWQQWFHEKKSHFLFYYLFKLEALRFSLTESWNHIIYWAEKIKCQSERPKVKCVNLIGKTECSVARFKTCKTTKTSLKLSNWSVFWPALSGTDNSFSVIKRCLAVFTTLLSLYVV